jgi:hypothetical protein
VSLFSPEACLDVKATFIGYRNHPFVFLLTILQSTICDLINCTHNSNQINRSSLVKNLNLRDRQKAETFVLYGLVVWHFNNFGLLVKHDAKIILDRSKPLVCDFDSSIWEQINASFCDHWVKFITSVFEKGSLNLGSVLVHQIDVHEIAFCPLIFPTSPLSFLGNSCLDPPVIVESWKSLNRRVSIISKVVSSSSLVRVFLSVFIFYFFIVVLLFKQGVSVLIKAILCQNIFWNGDIMRAVVRESFFLDVFIILWRSNSSRRLLINDFGDSAEDKDDSVLNWLFDESENLNNGVLANLLAF